MKLILLAIFLLGSCVVIGLFTHSNIFLPIVVAPTIIATSVWIGLDSAKLHVWQYQTGLSYKPVVLVVLSLMVWVVAFPWYLYVRQTILTGKARLRPEYLSSTDGMTKENV